MACSANTRVATQQQMGYVPHTTVSGETWCFVREGIADSGSATTLVDAQALGVGDDYYNGRYWIKITSGANKGSWKRIIDYVSASGTFTFENNGFDNAVAADDTYQIWQSPEPVVVVDSSSGETNAVDAIRAEADDFWNGYYLIPITGARRGQAPALITDFVSSTGTFTLAAGLGGALAAGDVCLIRKFIQFGNINNGLTENYIAKIGNRINFSKGDGILGARGGTFGFSSEVEHSGSLTTSGACALAPSGGLLPACGYVEVVDSASVAGTSADGNNIKIATGSWENHTIGSAIIWEGNVTWITGMTDGAAGEDTLVVSPALPAPYPQTGEVISPVRLYKKSIDADVLGCVLELEQDGVRTTMTGCKGNVVYTDGEVPTFVFNLNVDHWVREVEAAPYNAGSAYTGQAVVTQDRLAYLDTTKTNVKGFTASLNTETQPRMIQGSAGINGRAGYQLTGYAEGGTWQELLSADSDTLPQELRWTARTAKDLKVLIGSALGFFGVRIPVARHVEVPTPNNADQMLETPNVFEAQDAGATNDGGGTSQKVPDFSFFLT